MTGLGVTEERGGGPHKGEGGASVLSPESEKKNQDEKR